MARTDSGRTARGDKDRPNRKTEWLEAYAREITVSDACKASGVGRSTAYEWKAEDQWFAEAWAEIEVANTEALEKEAQRRARIGYLEPVFYQGIEVGTVRKYSDTLLTLLLKARKPDVYRERSTVTHQGDADNPVRVEARPDLSQLSADDLRTWHELMQKAAVEDQMQ